jgi:hypothetical protein
VLGVVAPEMGTLTCLLAWDASTNMVKSAVSQVCLGDWDCPSGSFCDDQIPPLPASFPTKFAVCNPGPRGTLTPAMLVP